MNNDLISRSALKEEFLRYKPYAVDFLSLIDNAPTVKPCENCDLYFKAMTKEEMRKGGKAVQNETNN